MRAHLKVQLSKTFQINMLDFKEEESRQIKGYTDTLKLKLKPKRKTLFTGKAQSVVKILRPK